MLPITNPQSNVYLLDDETYQKKRKAPLSDKKKEKIIGECQKNIGRWYDYFSDNIRRFRMDKQFFRGEQWNYWEYNQYSMLGKVPYTMNKLKPLVRQLCGEQANMAPNINLMPNNIDDLSQKNAMFLTKFVRALAYNSHADRAYSEAFLNQLVGGWGVLQVATDYEDPYNFDQKIEIRTVRDPLTVGFDPTAQKLSKSDGDYQFQYEIINKDDFEAQWPNAKVPPPGAIFGSQRDFLPQLDDKSVMIVDYYVKEYKTKTLVELTNHIDFKIDVLSEDVEETTEQYMQMMTARGMDLNLIPPLIEVNRRRTKLTFIHCYKLTMHEILEHYEWHSTKFPFVFVDGFSAYQDGRQYTESFINGARDAQKTYNYCMSEAINGLSRLRREQVWMTRTQAEGQEEWLKYPDRQQSHGEYTPDPQVNGGAPIFRPPEQLPEAFFQLAAQAEEDIYKTLGVFPANRGELPNQTSGVAIGRTIMQGNLAFVQLLQNLFNAMQVVGEIVLELIPKIYDSERIVATLDETGRSQSAPINQAQGDSILNDVTAGIYKLEVAPIASFAIQQEMVSEQLYKLAELNPQFTPVLGDLIASTIQSPIATSVVERLRNFVPPAILAKENGMPPPPPPPPNPQEVLGNQLMQAKINETNARAMKAQKDAMNIDATNGLKAEQIQNDAISSHLKTIMEAAKLEQTEKETELGIEKAYIDADAEIKKQQLQSDVEAMKTLNEIHKRDVETQKYFSTTRRQE